MMHKQMESIKLLMKKNSQDVFKRSITLQRKSSFFKKTLDDNWTSYCTFSCTLFVQNFVSDPKRRQRRFVDIDMTYKQHLGKA